MLMPGSDTATNGCSFARTETEMRSSAGAGASVSGSVGVGVGASGVLVVGCLAEAWLTVWVGAAGASSGGVVTTVCLDVAAIFVGPVGSAVVVCIEEPDCVGGVDPASSGAAGRVGTGTA